MAISRARALYYSFQLMLVKRTAVLLKHDIIDPLFITRHYGLYTRNTRICINVNKHKHKPFTAKYSQKREMDGIMFDRISEETLDELTSYFEDLGDTCSTCPPDYDVQFSSGVLTISLGGNMGTYVINKQAPNKQIWLSSPHSGPKRYDIIDNHWRYYHDNTCLHDLLAEEISDLLNVSIDLSHLNYYKIPTN